MQCLDESCMPYRAFCEIKKERNVKNFCTKETVHFLRKWPLDDFKIIKGIFLYNAAAQEKVGLLPALLVLLQQSIFK